MIFIDIFNKILFEPILNLLVYFYNFLPGESLGWSIILLTVIISIVLWPVSQKGFKAQRAMQQVQPKLNEIKEKYKDDKQKQSQEMMKFYKENKVSPFASCLPLIIQGIVLIGLYQALRRGILSDIALDETVLYSWVKSPGELNTYFFGMDLAATRNWIFAILAGLFQFGQTWFMMWKRKQDKTLAKPKKKGRGIMSEAMTKNMMFITPLITVWFGFVLPAGLALYWAARSLIAMAQQGLILYQEKRNPNTNDKKDDTIIEVQEEKE
ncbi:YidC/Oxa1 family membrane protein insertase [Patescibacteria group bacterium]